MSLIQFQTGLAELIRLPEMNRGFEFSAFLERFNLTEIEKIRLRKLAEDPKVSKYGSSMAGVRWETPEMQLRLAHRLIPKSALEHIYRDIFEPQAVSVRFHELTDRFLGCLIDDPKAKEVLSEAAPSSIYDVLKFERLQLSYYRGDITIEKESAPPGSLLRHGAFRLLALEYDVPAFILDLPQEVGIVRGEPEPRRLVVLFIPDEAGAGARYFEVDDSIQNFLEILSRNPLAEPGKPSSYSDLVALGLCKPLVSTS